MLTLSVKPASLERRYPTFAFGQAIFKLRLNRGFTRAELVTRLHANIHARDDELLSDQIMHVNELWLRRLENGLMTSPPDWLLELLISTLHCTALEIRELLDTLVPDIVKKYQDNSIKQLKKGSRAGRPKTEGLTERQFDVLRLAASGIPCRSIMKRLVVTKATIDTHWRRILEELNAESREEAIEIARAHRLI